jgi:endoglycosylceramidase
MRSLVRRAALVVCLFTSACTTPARPTSPIYSTGTTLVDQAGRSVVLRGVNIRAAGFFDAYQGQLPLPPFTADDCNVVGQELGMNQLRLPISWSLLEPTRGTFNQPYIDSILQLADACMQQGVYTLVDLHQDGWSKYLGSDGAPFWAHDPPLPSSAMNESSGGQSTVSAAVQAAFNGFYADPTLMQDYATMTAALAKAIDQQPGIIGLEIMNEPLGTQPQIGGLYVLVAPSVRAVAPGLPLYFEPDATRNLLDFANPEPLSVKDTVYSPHLYTGVFQGNWMIGEDSRIEASIEGMQSEKSQADAALMVTEFGNDPADPVGAAWLTAALTLLDQYAVSASFWVYEEWPSTCGNPSCWGLYDETPVVSSTGQTTYARTLRPAAVTLLARAYPRAISGHLDSFSYDTTTKTLTVQMHDAHGTHELAAPTLIYTTDVNVTCDGVAVSVVRTGSRVSVACSGTVLVMSPS